MFGSGQFGSCQFWVRINFRSMISSLSWAWICAIRFRLWISFVKFYSVSACLSILSLVATIALWYWSTALKYYRICIPYENKARSSSRTLLLLLPLIFTKNLLISFLWVSSKRSAVVGIFPSLGASKLCVIFSSSKLVTPKALHHQCLCMVFGSISPISTSSLWLWNWPLYSHQTFHNFK